MQNDDLDREMLEAEALASECETPEQWEAVISLRTGDAQTKIIPTDKAESVGPTPPPVPPRDEPAHPVARVTSELPPAPVSHVPQVNKPDEAGELDDEYWSTFNGTVEEVKDLEPEQMQELRHRLDRMIRRAKIQLRAIRVTEEGKLQFVEEKRRKAMRVKDAEFMAERKVAQGDATTTDARERKAKKEAREAVSKLEKQIKQFVKLNMNDASIEATLKDLHGSVPDNLAELIAKYRK